MRSFSDFLISAVSASPRPKNLWNSLVSKVVAENCHFNTHCLNIFSYEILKMLVSKYELSTEATCSNLAISSNFVGGGITESGDAYLATRYLHMALDSKICNDPSSKAGSFPNGWTSRMKSGVYSIFSIARGIRLLLFIPCALLSSYRY